jgi:hypothetical protein
MSDMFGWFYEEPEVRLELTDEEREELKIRLAPAVARIKAKLIQKERDKCKVELDDDLFNV